MNNEIPLEVPNYLKRKESNISKADKKSKHKHQYAECLIQYNFSFIDENHLCTRLDSYCTVCGKIGGMMKNSIVTDFHRKEIVGGRTHYFSITEEELYEKYHDKLPVFFVDNIFAKKINVESEKIKK